MKILLFHPTLLPPKNYGGVERVVLWLAKGLQERGHEVYVAALSGSRLPEGCHLIEVESRNYSALELNSLFPPGLDLIHFMAPFCRGHLERIVCSSSINCSWKWEAG